MDAEGKKRHNEIVGFLTWICGLLVMNMYFAIKFNVSAPPSLMGVVELPTFVLFISFWIFASGSIRMAGLFDRESKDESKAERKSK